jgi:hypothetical protein
MPEDKQVKQANAGSETSGGESPAPESDVSAPSAEGREVEEKTPSTDEEASAPDQSAAESEGKERPSRAEERIRELTGKLKEAKQAGEQAQFQQPSQAGGDLPWAEREEPMVQPGQELTPEEYQRHVNARAARLAELKVRQVLQQEKQRSSQSKAINDWVSDAENLQRDVKILDKESDEYDPDIAESFSRLVARANRTPDGQAVPMNKPSELWEDFQKALKKEGTKRAGQVSASLAKQQAESATPPSQSVKGSKDYEDEELFNKAKESGRDEDWAQVIKKRMFGK